MFRPMFAIALLVFSLVASQAWAQPEGGLGAGMISGGMLLRQESVQTELGITAEQKEKFHAALGERLRDAAAGT